METFHDGRRLRTGQVIPVKGGIYKQMWEKPVATTASNLVKAEATDSVSITTVSTFLTTIDFARNIIVTPGGTTADVKAGDVTVVGTNIRGDSITETIAIIANQSTASNGLFAFATIVSVSIVAQDDDAATYDIGVGDVLGLEKHLQFNSIGGNAAAETGTVVSNLAREGTAPTVVVDTQSIHKNTIDFNTALAVTKTYATYMITEDPAIPAQSEV